MKALPGVAVALLLAGCGTLQERSHVERAAAPLDFAQLEHDEPLSRARLAALTPADIEAMDQETIDRLYARLTAGPIPDGAFDGTVVLQRGPHVKRVERMLGGLFAPFLDNKGKLAGDLVQGAWKGKVFDRREKVLRNRIPVSPATRAAGFIPAQAGLRDGDEALAFSARVYCGQSLLDGRRESIVVDYLFHDDLRSYHEDPDHLVGRRGLRVRDEIRMVRPGFYLGRAYVDRVFFVNFVLFRDSADREAPEDCWTGTQERRVTP